MEGMIQYWNGEPVQVGDRVEVKRGWFRSAVTGTVVSVFDPSKPSLPGGNNDFGYTVELDDGSFLFGGTKNKNVVPIK